MSQLSLVLLVLLLLSAVFSIYLLFRINEWDKSYSKLVSIKAGLKGDLSIFEENNESLVTSLDREITLRKAAELSQFAAIEELRVQKQSKPKMAFDDVREELEDLIMSAIRSF